MAQAPDPVRWCAGGLRRERTLSLVGSEVLRDWFWLYRPTAPSIRAQSIQVIHSAWALARRGHRVVLCVQGTASPRSVLEAYGLAPLPTLELIVLPSSNSLASALYRARFLAWSLRTAGQGIALARSKRHADWALRWCPGRFSLLIEAHEVDSELAARAGRDRAPAWDLERRVLAGARGVIANCGGTLAQLRCAHPVLPPAVVIHNAAGEAPPAVGQGQGIGCVGSIRPYKDPQTVARAAGRTREPVVWIGPAAQEVQALQGLAEGRIVWEPPLAHRQVPQRLSRFRALLLPLSPGLFGEQLTSPLKLWDALASGVPLVAADTPAIREAAGRAFVPYRPADADDLVAALERACSDEALRRSVLAAARLRVRRWSDRAAEIEAFADRVAP